jgi:hypothetical protein
MMKVSSAAKIGLLALAFLAAPQFLPAPPNPISSLSLSPTSVLGGSSSTGTVTLASAAPTGGAVVTLTSSNTSAATVPSSVTVLAGQTSKTFPVTTLPVGASTSVTITASYSTGTKTATLTVTPAVLTTVSVSPTSVAGGAASTGTVLLSGAAPAAGANVTLSSSNPSVAAVPGSATVPSGATSATFAITTFNVASSTNVTITAVYTGTTKTTILTVTPAPPALSALSVNPATVLATSTANGTATLNQAAPTGGAVVALSSLDPSVASVPANITIPAGATSGGFSVTTYSVPADSSATISGSYGGATKTASLTVLRTFTLTLDNGVGPFYTNLSTVGVKGHVAPGNIGPTVLVRGTLGAQNVTATPASDGAFTLPNLTLSAGSNAVSVTGTAGSQSVGPLVATYVFDNVAPTGSVVLGTNVPNPTNIPTWTLSGTISGYQSTSESAFVYLNGGSTRFPVAANGTWSGSYTFAEGYNRVNFAVADLAGNQGYPTPQDFSLNTQGIKPVFETLELLTEASGFGWPLMLDETISQYVDLRAENNGSLNGSHVDLFFDEQGTFPASPPAFCAPENLTCLVTRKTIPDISADLTANSLVAVTLPIGIHTMRMVLRDPWGRTYERGALLPVGLKASGILNGEYEVILPLANFGTPGMVTTQKPKLVGRIVDGIAPIDCNDKPGNRLPTFSYWNPAQGGSWQTLAVNAASTSVTGGVYQATPTSNIPITTLTSGQKVLRVKLTEGVIKTSIYGLQYLEDTFNRNICNGQTVVSNKLIKGAQYWPPDGVTYDLPYRSSVQSDNPAPQIDTSAIQSVSTDNGDPYTLSARFRITDLNGDLDSRNVTVATAGCGGSPSCTYSARLAGDQLLTGAQPGGHFTVQLPLALGANNFVATARDDAAHVTNQSFTVNRNLTEVVAKITSPATEGQTYFFCSPKTVTFDASNSINRTNPPVSLRYQWTNSNGNLLSSVATYSATLQFQDTRRVIVSSSAIPAPNPAITDVCASSPAGKCSIATIGYQPFDVPTGTLPAQVLSPSNAAAVRLDLPVTLDGTVGQNADPSYVYKWRLKRTSDGVFFTIPQATGTGSDPSYAVGNRTLTLRLDSIPGVVAGNYTLFFDAASQTQFGSCIAQQSTSSISITVTTKQYAATGLSPGAVVVGDASRLYGSGFDAAARIAVSGPIHTLTDTTTNLCTMPSCPQVVLAAAPSADGKTLDFTTPSTLGPGYYLVFASDPATGAASPALWLEVQPSQNTAPAKTQEFSNWAWPILDGQTLNGQFLAGRDPSGQFSDVDYYYFFAPAGSTLSLALSRTDTSLPWEAPDALDPQLLVADPDGLINQGFQAFDKQKGVDLNASLTNVVLAKTGMYVVDAATSKGFGPYQLSFTLVPAPPPSGRQVVAAANNDRSVPVNMPGFKPMALAFDPRGYPLSGAVLQYVSTPEANETGRVSFPNGSNISTSTRGLAQVDATVTQAGKISFEARLQDAGLIVPQQALVTEAAWAIPSYRPVAFVTNLAGGFDPRTGGLQVRQSRMERLELGGVESPVVGFKENDKGQAVRQPGPRIADSAKLPPVLSTGPSRSRSGISPETISTCTPATFRAAGVNVASVAGPFTVTITDLTPKTGQSTGTEVIGVDGIHEHRVNKTIRMKISIKDANGLEPTYPVLVHVAVLGDPPGMLILDPDGARIECQSASFLWHEPDGQGGYIANDEFEYHLTTRSAFVGVKPDPQNAGEVLPVWGTSEFLSVFFGTFDDETGALTNQFSAKYGVHPEAGSPDHFKWNPTSQPPPHRMEYLAAYDADFGFNTYTNGLTILNLYYLADQYDNTIYGFRSTSATDPAANVQMTFAAQDPLISTTDPAGYKLGVHWNDNPSGASPKPASVWPNGEYASTLTISGTDIETGPFTVSQAYTAVFSQPTFYSLVWVNAYDPPNGAQSLLIDTLADFSVDPPVAINVVSPGAPRARLNGELSRNSIVLVTGTRLAYGSTSPGFIGFEDSQGDPMVVSDGLDSFDVSLVDDKGSVVPDAEIQASLCPKYDHRGVPTWAQVDTRPCPGNLSSSDGVILGVRPIDRGYMGLMVSRAPTAPGVYFFRITPVPSNVHQWRVGGSLDPNNNYTYTYAVTVRGGEFLDEDYRAINPYIVDKDTLAFFRYRNGKAVAPPDTVTIESNAADNPSQTASITIALSKLGRSESYMTGPFVLHPPAAVAPQDTGLAHVATAATAPILDVFGPSSNLTARFSDEKIGQADADVSGLNVKVEWLPRGERTWLPYGAAPNVYGVLKPGRPSYLGDAVRLSAKYPDDWPPPVGYLWTLKVDGENYTPEGVDLTLPSVELDPVRKAGVWEVRLLTTYLSGATAESSKRQVEIWLETEPAAAIGWIDDRLIDTTQYEPGTTHSREGDCTKVFDLQLAFMQSLISQPPPTDELPFYNAAILACIGGSPLNTIYWEGFDTETDLRDYLQADANRINYKIGSAWYQRFPVSKNKPDIGPRRAGMIEIAESGFTEKRLSGFPFVLGTFPSEPGPNNGEVLTATVGGLNTVYLLNEARVGEPAQELICWLNTGSSTCNTFQFVPFVWSKLIATPQDPSVQLGLQRPTTSFPSFQFYAPSTEDHDLGFRRFPLSKRGPLRVQEEPNVFLGNPQHSSDN